jgi:hypothetical protein
MIKKFLKGLILLYIMACSCLAIYINYIGDFDPVAMAAKLKGEGKRDEALDVLQFSISNKIGDQKELKRLREEYKYSAFEKSKDLFWHGAVKGNVFNMYSGVGCIAADLLIIGDIRDLSKEGYKMFTDEDVDYIVLSLSTIGLAANAAEFTAVGAPAGAATDAGASVLKTMVKYTSKVIKNIPDGVLKVFVTGKKVGSDVYAKIWILFKETKFSIPNVTTILSKVKDIKYLDATVDITKNLKKGAVIFISKTGENGLKTYEYFKKLKIGNFFISSFKRNPKGVLGITKFQTSIRSIKFLKKHDLFMTTTLLITLLAKILAMFPVWVPATVVILSILYFAWTFRRKRKKDKKISNPGLIPEVAEKNLVNSLKPTKGSSTNDVRQF